MPTESVYNEPELLHRIARGEKRAFQTVLDKYAPLLFTYLTKLTFDKSLAEELVQDVFLKIWQTRESLVQVQNFKSYLFTIARNQSINAVKKIIRERKQHQDWQMYTNSILSSTEADANWRYSIIDEAIEQLPPQQKAVLIKSRKEGMKLDDIAREMQLTKATVKKYLQRALEAILYYVQQRATIIFALAFLNNL